MFVRFSVKNCNIKPILCTFKLISIEKRLCCWQPLIRSEIIANISTKKSINNQIFFTRVDERIMSKNERFWGLILFWFKHIPCTQNYIRTKESWLSLEEQMWCYFGNQYNYKINITVFKKITLCSNLLFLLLVTEDIFQSKNKKFLVLNSNNW